jgi:hypothetical protein
MRWLRSWAIDLMIRPSRRRVTDEFLADTEPMAGVSIGVGATPVSKQ